MYKKKSVKWTGFATVVMYSSSLMYVTWNTTSWNSTRIVVCRLWKFLSTIVRRKLYFNTVNSPINAQEMFLECGALTKTALNGVILTLCKWGWVKIQIQILQSWTFIEKFWGESHYPWPYIRWETWLCALPDPWLLHDTHVKSLSPPRNFLLCLFEF